MASSLTVTSLTVQSVIKILHYDQLSELQNKLNENTYYYLLCDWTSEIIEIYDISYATKILAYSTDDLLNQLLSDKKLIRLLATTNNLLMEFRNVLEELTQRYNLHYLNPIDDEIDSFIKSRIPEAELIKAIIKSINSRGIVTLWNHKLELVLINDDHQLVAYRNQHH